MVIKLCGCPHTTAIELIWGQVKDYVAKRNTFKLASFKPLIEESITRITMENWRDAVKLAENFQTEDVERCRE